MAVAQAAAQARPCLRRSTVALAAITDCGSATPLSVLRRRQLGSLQRLSRHQHRAGAEDRGARGEAVDEARAAVQIDTQTAMPAMAADTRWRRAGECFIRSWAAVRPPLRHSRNELTQRRCRYVVNVSKRRSNFFDLIRRHFVLLEVHFPFAHSPPDFRDALGGSIRR